MTIARERAEKGCVSDHGHKETLAQKVEQSSGDSLSDLKPRAKELTKRLGLIEPKGSLGGGFGASRRVRGGVEEGQWTPPEDGRRGSN